MSKVVVLNLTSSGHINPTLPLITELISRGERVIYYAIEQYRSIIESTGAQYQSYSHPEYLVPKAHQGEFFGSMAHFAKAAQVNLPALLKELKQDPPDYILLDSMCIWGNLVQQITKLPAITFSSIFIMHPTMKVDDILEMVYSPRPKEVVFKGLQSMYRYFEISQEINQQYNCKIPGLIEAFSNPQHLNILFTSRKFHPFSEMYDAKTYKFVGQSISPRFETISFPFEQLKSGITIYISLGTIVNDAVEFYKDCYQAFGNRPEHPYPHQVILSIGNKVNLANLGSIPDNFVIMSHVPQLEVLKKTSVFITHGGMNSVGEALWYGVPLVVVPHRGDAFLVAQQVVSNGAGLSMMPAQVSPDTLHDAVAKILSSPTFKQKAEELGQSLRSAGGYVKAADEIMAYKNKIGLS